MQLTMFSRVRRVPLQRIALLAFASSMVVSALSLQALGAWHVYRSIRASWDDADASTHAQPSCDFSNVPSLHPSFQHEAIVEPPAHGANGTLPPPDPPPDMDAPVCDFGELILIAASEDPRWSLAAIRSGGGSARMHRFGDAIAGHRVASIGWDAVELSNGAERCRMRLGVPASARTLAMAPATIGDDASLAAALARHVHKAPDGSVVIERAAIDIALERLGELWVGGRVRRVDAGLRLTRLPEGDLAAKLGLRRDDVLVALNGFDVRDPRALLQAHARLSSADHLTVTLLRDDRRVVLDLAIR
jgi:general secretion pathway protein C